MSINIIRVSFLILFILLASSTTPSSRIMRVNAEVIIELGATEYPALKVVKSSKMRLHRLTIKPQDAIAKDKRENLGVRDKSERNRNILFLARRNKNRVVSSYSIWRRHSCHRRRGYRRDLRKLLSEIGKQFIARLL